MSHDSWRVVFWTCAVFVPGSMPLVMSLFAVSEMTGLVGLGTQVMVMLVLVFAAWRCNWRVFP